MFLQLAHTKTPVFQESKKFILECYRITKDFPKDERFAMVQQMRRAALSVHLNIAEGCSRKSEGERKRFFEISRGSLIEVDAADQAPAAQTGIGDFQDRVRDELILHAEIPLHRKGVGIVLEVRCAHQYAQRTGGREVG